MILIPVGCPAFRSPFLSAVAFLCVCEANHAAGGDLWLDFNLGSVHDRDRYFWQGSFHEYNESNFGLGLTYEYWDRLEFKAGWFENSYEKTSIYALAHGNFVLVGSPDRKPGKEQFVPQQPVPFYRTWSLEPGIGLGLVTGYDDTPENAPEISPWGMGTLGIQYTPKWRLTIGYIPSSLFFDDGVDLAFGQLSYKF